MLDTTFQILADHPVALPAFLFAGWVVYRAVKAARSRVIRGAVYATAVGVIPLFGVLVVAEFTDNQFWGGIATGLIQLESTVIELSFEFVDAVLSAWLRLFLLLLDGLLALMQDLIGSVIPVLTSQKFLLAAFGFEFLAGAGLIYSLYRTSRVSEESTWLTGIGMVMLISGVFWALINANVWNLNESTLAFGLFAASLGLALGVASTILFVKPDFSGEGVSEMLNTDEREDETSESSLTAEIRRRIAAMRSKREE